MFNLERECVYLPKKKLMRVCFFLGFVLFLVNTPIPKPHLLNTAKNGSVMENRIIFSLFMKFRGLQC